MRKADKENRLANEQINRYESERSLAQKYQITSITMASFTALGVLSYATYKSVLKNCLTTPS